MKRIQTKTTIMLLGLATLVLLTPNLGLAHCDTMDGPVVKAAESVG